MPAPSRRSLAPGCGPRPRRHARGTPAGSRSRPAAQRRLPRPAPAHTTVSPRRSHARARERCTDQDARVGPSRNRLPAVPRLHASFAVLAAAVVDNQTRWTPVRGVAIGRRTGVGDACSPSRCRCSPSPADPQPGCSRANNRADRSPRTAAKDDSVTPVAGFAPRTRRGPKHLLRLLPWRAWSLRGSPHPPPTRHAQVATTSSRCLINRH
jgi:hypothetical protein